MKGDKESKKNRQTNGRTDRQTGGRTDGRSYSKKEREMDAWMLSWTDGRTDRRTGGRTDRGQMNR